ncbi:MAG: NAD-dependent epimerase/dehydratase family protein [Verrucomicrobiota bacterium]
MSSSRVLVTGAAGFIGSHVAEACVGLGFATVGLDDLSGGFRRNVPAGCRFFEGDVRDPRVVAELWRSHGPFDHVYHLAAYAAEGLSPHIRRYNYDTNLLGSVNLINASLNHGVQHFVFASSIAVYGAGQVPLREDTVPRPEDPYGISKYAVELDLEAARRVFGLSYTIFRPHNVYGERQHHGDRYRNVVGIFINQCLNGEPMTVFGDGAQTRAFSYIGDVAPVIARAPLVAGARDQVFNLGADTPVRVIDLARQVAQHLGVEPRWKHLPARPEVVHAFADHTRVREVFGTPPATPLAEGLRRTVAWVRHLGPIPPTAFEAIEVPARMPEVWRRPSSGESR